MMKNQGEYKIEWGHARENMERKEGNFGNHLKYVTMDIYGDSLGQSFSERVKMEWKIWWKVMLQFNVWGNTWEMGLLDYGDGYEYKPFVKNKWILWAFICLI